MLFIAGATVVGDDVIASTGYMKKQPTLGNLCTSRVSTMPWPCDMAGPHLNYHTNVNVGMECQWSTLSHVQKDASP